MQENYLAKWLNNELSKEELAEFKQSAEYASYQKIAELSQRMQAPVFNEDEAWNSFKDRNIDQGAKVIRIYPFKSFLRVAAVIALLLGGSYFYLNSLDKQYSTPYAQQSEVVLPDASEVTLNAGSKLAFNEKKWDDNREVSLEGEAFFKVAKGKKFTVTTEAGTVTVLGTQFNVEQRNGYFEVSCYEGLVSVGHQGKEHQLPAGNSFVAVNGGIQAWEVKVNSEPSWMANESSFKSVPLKYVLGELERQFNINVETQNVDTEQLFTGTFDNTDINLALESIGTPSQIRYKLEADKVLFYVGNTP